MLLLLGAIELSIFSDFFQVELDVVDIQTQRIDRFGKYMYINKCVRGFDMFWSMGRIDSTMVSLFTIGNTSWAN